MSPLETVCMECQSLFSVKSKKKYHELQFLFSEFSDVQPSPYCIYQFYDFNDHDTVIIHSTNNPEFNDHKTYPVPMTGDLDNYLKTMVNGPVIRKTYLYNFHPLKAHFYIVKLGFTGVYIIFLISAQKHRLWVLVRTASASWPRWLSWMRHLTGDQEVTGSNPTEIGNILSWRLIMKYFLRSFSPFCWFKKGSCQFLAKECAQYWLTA